MKQKTLTLLITLLFVLLPGCGSRDNAGVSGQDTHQGNIEIPESIIKLLAVLPEPQNLKAYLIIDGKTPGNLMAVNEAGDQVSLSVDNLAVGDHTFQIDFSYDTGEGVFGTIDLAASLLITKNLVNGTNIITSSDFLPYSYNDDNEDGVFNIDELALPIMLDPKRCIVGSSKIGACRLEIIL